MPRSVRWILCVVLCLPAASAAAQQSASPVADALRSSMQRAQKDLLASAASMPAEKYGYKPTPANLSFADHMIHLGDFNESMCSLISGSKAPEHAKLPAAAAKQQIVDHLRDSFAFCSTALARLDDSKLAEPLDFYGSQVSRAGIILVLSGDWSDHYAVTATYLRLNGLLPPTARP